ncbi:hypothetical protein BH09PAT3_BH09PAT3_7070 [soil metagenome]
MIKNKTFLSRMTTLAVAGVIALTAVFVVAPGAAYATDSPEVRGAAACGSGYKLTHDTRMRDHWCDPGAGMLQVFINRDSKKLCVIIMSLNGAYNKQKYMSLSLNIENNRTNDVVRRFDPDNGMFYKYAGPIYFSYPQYNKPYLDGVRTESTYWMNVSGRVDYHARYNPEARKGGEGAYLPERFSMPISPLVD